MSLDGSILDADGHRSFPAWPLPRRPPKRPDLTVGVILDDFSLLALGYEWHQVVLKPSSWRDQMAAEPLDLLFVESAWRGNHDAWQYHLTGPSAPRPALVELIQWCRRHDIPTVFWNKEDPAHFEDFLESAKLFDQVFTTDSNMVAEYQARLGHDRVDTLMFAAQPAIHNPIRPRVGHQSRDVAFAGMYFAHKYPERREQMDLLLGAADRVSHRMEHGLEIYSRYLGADGKYQFPAPLDQRVVGSLSYDRMLSAYRAYKVFLNVNTVVTSPTMCARRIFEIIASGSAVVSTPSPAISATFRDGSITQTSTPDEAEFALRTLVRNAGLRDRNVHRAQRDIWASHTYSHRVHQVLQTMGRPRFANDIETKLVTALVSTNRPHRLEHVLRTLGSQRGVDLQVALLTHGFEPNQAQLRSIASEHGLSEMILLEATSDVPLGECLKKLTMAADGEILAKIDDDDHYGRHYLADAVRAMEYSQAEIVGKQAHYLYLAGPNVTVLRFASFEHKYTDRVMGPTLVYTRDIARSTPFKPLHKGEDSSFLVDAVANGANIYSADRFNFVQVRGANPAAHTWAVSDMELMAGSDVEVYGRFPEHVMI